MGKIINLKDRKETKDLQQLLLDSYIMDNSIILQNKDDPHFEIIVTLDVDDTYKLTIDDLIDDKVFLCNVVVCDENDLDSENGVVSLIYRPRWADVMVCVAQHLEKQGITNSLTFVYDVECIDEGTENSNTFLIYYYNTGSMDE
jgi:hypothetical protein